MYSQDAKKIKFLTLMHSELTEVNATLRTLLVMRIPLSEHDFNN